MGSWLAPLAAWIGPVLIMRYARDYKAGRGYLFILAACSLAFLIGFGSIWTYFGLLMVPIRTVTRPVKVSVIKSTRTQPNNTASNSST